MDNAQRLKALMRRHQLTRPDVARELGVGVSTVDSWLAPLTAASHRNMPDRLLRLLKLTLAQSEA